MVYVKNCRYPRRVFVLLSVSYKENGVYYDVKDERGRKSSFEAEYCTLIPAAAFDAGR